MQAAQRKTVWTACSEKLLTTLTLEILHYTAEMPTLLIAATGV